MPPVAADGHTFGEEEVNWKFDPLRRMRFSADHLSGAPDAPSGGDNCPCVYPPGTELFDVLAAAAPGEKYCGTSRHNTCGHDNRTGK
jgi:hypothetical protein